jgi:hypothetical protein
MSSTGVPRRGGAEDRGGAASDATGRRLRAMALKETNVFGKAGFLGLTNKRLSPTPSNGKHGGQSFDRFDKIGKGDAKFRSNPDEVDGKMIFSAITHFFNSLAESGGIGFRYLFILALHKAVPFSFRHRQRS